MTTRPTHVLEAFHHTVVFSKREWRDHGREARHAFPDVFESFGRISTDAFAWSSGWRATPHHSEETTNLPTFDPVTVIRVRLNFKRMCRRVPYYISHDCVIHHRGVFTRFEQGPAQELRTVKSAPLAPGEDLRPSGSAVLSSQSTRSKSLKGNRRLEHVPV